MIKYIISSKGERETKDNKIRKYDFFKGGRLQNFQTGRGSTVRSLGLQ